MMISTCGTCGRVFPGGGQDLQDHIAATGHESAIYMCHSCDNCFASRHHASKHMDEMSHWDSVVLTRAPDAPTVSCRKCSSRFSITEAARKHEQEHHFYCTPCDVVFKHSKDMNLHLSGPAHRNSLILCPFCNHKSSTAAGLISHFENGHCPDSPFTRDVLYEAVLRRDPKNVISRQLEETAMEKFQATEETWNPEALAYECRLCHRLFKQLGALQHHLNSRVHPKTFYHCPNPRCVKLYETLGGMVHHLQTETCQFMRFEAVQKQVEEALKPYRITWD